jgi:hypothetical protein
MLSRMHGTGCAGASHSPSRETGVLPDALLARVLDDIESATPSRFGEPAVAASAGLGEAFEQCTDAPPDAV